MPIHVQCPFNIKIQTCYMYDTYKYTDQEIGMLILNRKSDTLVTFHVKSFHVA